MTTAINWSEVQKALEEREQLLERRAYTEDFTKTSKKVLYSGTGGFVGGFRSQSRYKLPKDPVVRRAFLRTSYELNQWVKLGKQFTYERGACMPLVYAEPEVFMDTGDFIIYHTYKGGNGDRVMEYWYSTDNAEREEYEFDVRLLPVPDGVAESNHPAIIKHAFEAGLLEFPEE